jgi:hypothetical protein
MIAYKNEGDEMTLEPRVMRLEIIIEHINETLKEIKSNQKDLSNEIKTLRTEVWSQTKWILGFIFLILGSPYFTALLSKLSLWVQTS